MIFYINIIILLSIIFILPIKKNIKLILAFITLSVISGLRIGVGTDYYLYETIYENIFNLSGDSSHIENGYVLLNKIIYYIFDDSRMLFFITAIITIGLIIKSINDYSNNYKLSIILFVMLGYYHSSFNGIRQYIAIAICMISMRYIKRKDFLKYIILIFISSLFHRTALIMIPLYFLLNIDYSKEKYTLLMSICFIIGLSYNFIAYKILPYIGGFYFEKYGASIHMKNGLNGKADYIYIISFIMICIISILLYDKIKIKTENNEIFLTMCILSIPFMMLGTRSQLFFRVSLYFSIYYIYLIPLVIQSLNIKIKLGIYPMFVFWILFFYATTLLDRDGAIPYIMDIFKLI